MNTVDSYQKSLNLIILKATSYMGAASSLNVLFGLIRMKFAALYIGVAGVGLLTNYRVIQTFIGSLVGLGIRQSAVRDIASALANHDKNSVGEIIQSLRILTLIIGLIGALTIYFLSPIISSFVFNTNLYAYQLSFLAIAIFFGNLTGGQLALLQGMGQTKKLALFNILSGFFNLMVSIYLFITFGKNGVIASMVALSIIEFLIALVMVNKIPFRRIKLTLKTFIKRVNSMVVLGFSFMITSLGASLVAVLINSLITKNISLESVGVYAASTALTTIFITFVLSAMSTDFYPRLTSLINDRNKAISLINSQTQIGICLVLPGLFATAALADYIVPIIYSKEFENASSLMPLMILGCLPRVISWPLAYIMLAKAASRLIIISEIFLSTINFLFVFFLIQKIGIWAPVLGLLIVRLFHIIICFIIGRHLINFYWSKKLLSIILISFITLFLYIGTLYFLSGTVKIIFGAISTLIITLICIKNISSIVKLPLKYINILKKFKLVRN
jgi:enterobacterial common antigen flippase